MTDHASLSELDNSPGFASRHIGPDAGDVERMLEALGFGSLDELMAAAVPQGIRSAEDLHLPRAVTEAAAARELRELAASNRPAEALIGLGYHGTITPPVIRRNVLEDPSWYTAYTPYQPEISQGRLEALINFQTMVGDLTGLPTANSSLLDEGTAAAEAMTLVRRANKKATGPFVVDADALPQTIEVVRTRAEAMGIEVTVADLADGLPEGELCGVLVQYPGASGRVLDPRPVIEAAHERNALVVVAADLLALALLESPGELGADVVVGSSQRFGVPLFYGGPHAGFMAVSAGLERHLPGPARRRLRRRRGPPGVPPGPADPRAAHPPRQGDLQHLHRAGAAGRRRVDVRRLPRPRGHQGDRDPRAPVRRGAGPGADRRRHRGRAPRVLRHPDRGGARPRRRGGGRRPQPRPAPAPRRRRPRGAVHLRDHHPLDAHRAAAGVRRGHRRHRPGLDRPAGRRQPARRAAPRRPTTSPTRCSPRTTARPRCCATCAGSRPATTRWTAA